MKDMIKACLALVMVAILAVAVFYKGDSKAPIKKPTAAKTQTYTPKARIDVYTPKGKEQLMKVTFNGTDLKKEDWSKDNERYVAQSTEKTIKFTINAHQNFALTLDLRGPNDKKADGKLNEHWVIYSSVKVDGKEILSDPQTVWHDKPYKYDMNVKKGKTYQIEAVWQPKKDKN